MKDKTAVMCHNIAKYEREHRESGLTPQEIAEIFLETANDASTHVAEGNYTDLAADEKLYESLRSAASILRKIAAGEYKQVVHGRWIHTSRQNEDGMGGWHDVIECSICKENHDFEYDYCPSCGALMDEPATGIIQDGKDDSHE